MAYNRLLISTELSFILHWASPHMYNLFSLIVDIISNIDLNVAFSYIPIKENLTKDFNAIFSKYESNGRV